MSEATSTAGWGRHGIPPRPLIPPGEIPRQEAGHGASPPAWWQHVRHHLGAAWVWILAWVASRAWVLHLYLEKYQFINSDVNYYLWWLTRGNGIRNTLVEYPQPVVWFLEALTWFGREQSSYMLAFGLSMAALDAGFTAMLWRRRALQALTFWIAFVLVFGSLIWFRYDMLPAFVVGAAALVVARHPAVSGALVALGAGLKLWPAMLIAPLAGRSRPAVRRTIAFLLTGAALALAAWWQGGWKRLTSPLTWQADRGLQVESVPASWLMWQRATSDGTQWRVEMSKYNAFEIFGPGIERWMHVSDMVMLGAVLSAAGMALVMVLRRQLPADLLVLCMVSIVLSMLVANKTLSPQYLLWLGTPVAALLALAHTPTMRRRAQALAATTLLAALLTQQVYPAYYGHIIGADPQVTATGMMVTRNLLLVVMMVVSAIWAWADLTDVPDRTASLAEEDFAEDEVSSEMRSTWRD